jgi:hypothetical protein
MDIVLFVGPELLHELRVLEEADDRGGRRVQRLEPGEHLGAARDHVGRDVVGAVERFVDVHGIVDHVGAVEEANLGLEDLAVGVELPLLQELKKREHQVAVQLRRHQRRQVVLRHGWMLVRGGAGTRGEGDAGAKRVCGFVDQVPIVAVRVIGRPR